MSQDRNDNFDLQLRSMLADAEEKVPSGVWRAVSSRIGGGASPAWGWAVAGLAFASFAIALVLGGTFGRTSHIPSDAVAVVSAVPETVQHSSASLLADAGDDALSAGTVDCDGSVERGPRSARKCLPAAVSGFTSMTSASDGRSSVPVSPDAADSAVVDINASVPASPDATDAVAEAADATPTVSDDPFARMAMEDALETRDSGWSFDLGGSVTGSENTRSFIANRTSGVAATSLHDRITETSISTFGIPFTMGLTARHYMSKRFSVASGIDFSLLTRTFTGQFTPTGGTSTEGDITHTMVYFGIPVNLYFDVLMSQAVKFYVFGGGEAQYGFVNRYHIRELDKYIYDPVEGVQFSAGVGLGVEFKVSRHLGIYIDPSVNYYFNGDQPKSVRTERPFMFNFNAGLRFNL